jgi:hypothetical protein
MPNQKTEDKEESIPRKLRWEDGVDSDVEALGERFWKNISRNKQN